MTDYKNHPTIKKLLKESYANPNYRDCLCNFDISDIKDLYVYDTRMPIAMLIVNDGMYNYYNPHSFVTDNDIDVYFLLQKISIQIKNSKIYDINIKLMCILSNDFFYKIGSNTTISILKGGLITNLTKV